LLQTEVAKKRTCIMKFFVTGASGFVGTAIVKILLLRSDVSEVRVLARKAESVRHLHDKKCKIIVGDLGDLRSLAEGVDGVQVVIHSAALVSDWGTWSAFHAANVDGTRNMLQAVKDSWKDSPPAAPENQTKLKLRRETKTTESFIRFVHISTGDVYGFPTDAKYCSETRPMKKIGLPYNNSKVLAEELVWQAAKEGLPVTVIRPGNVYGPAGKDFITEVCETIEVGVMPLIGGGKVSAGLVYIDNLAEGIVKASTRTETVGQAYNLCDEDGDIPWYQYCNDLADRLKCRRPWLYLPFWVAYFVGFLMELVYGLLRVKSRPLVTRHACRLLGTDQNFPIEKAKKDFGYASRVSYSEGLERSMAWYFEQKKQKKTT